MVAQKEGKNLGNDVKEHRHLDGICESIERWFQSDWFPLLNDCHALVEASTVVVPADAALPFRPGFLVSSRRFWDPWSWLSSV